MPRPITLIIPTFNQRHHYLNRLLDYYREADFQILVADASTRAYPDADNYSNVRYLHTPGMGYTEKLHRAVAQSATRYVVMCADDDFITPTGLDRCMEFLDEHADYASAQGHLVSFPNPGRVRPMPFMFHTVGIDINDDLATDRIDHFFRYHIYLHYSVHRRENLEQTFSSAVDFSDTFILGLMEYFLDIICIIHGKHKVLPVFYSAQELTKVSGRNTYKGITEVRELEQFKIEYERFITKLAGHLVKQQNLDAARAKEFIEGIFLNSPYFSRKAPALPERISRPLGGSVFQPVKKAVDRLKGISAAKRAYSRVIHSVISKRHSLNNNLRLLKQLNTARQTPGFPFGDGIAKREWKNIETAIRSHRSV